MEITNESVFLTAFKNAVISSFPNTDKCKQLQSFAVLRSDTVIGTAENLGMTICEKEKCYFWSREFQRSGFKVIKYSFPLLYIKYLYYTKKNIFRKSGKESSLTVEIGIVDQVFEPLKNNCKGCKGRNFHEVVEDTRKLLSYALQFAGAYQWGTVGGTLGWHQSLCNAIEQCGKELNKFMQCKEDIEIFWSGNSLAGVLTEITFRMPSVGENIVSGVDFDCNPTDCGTLVPFTGCITC